MKYISEVDEESKTFIKVFRETASDQIERKMTNKNVGNDKKEHNYRYSRGTKNKKKH